MRLRNYISEITKPTTPRVRAIFNKQIPKIEKELAERNWEVSDQEAIRIFNKYFGRNNIEFKISKNSPKANVYVDYAQSWDDGSIDMFFFRSFSDVFEKYKDPEEEFDDFIHNPVLYDVFIWLSHEFIHKRQVFKSSGKGSTTELPDTTEEYLSQKHEIEAYAYQAYVEGILNRGKSEIYGVYMKTFPPNHPVRKRFLKKFAQYLQDYLARTKEKG